MGYRVAIVGATGNVGREMLNILEELEFPVDEIHAIASRKSKGVEVSFGDKTVKCQDIEQFDFSKVDIVLMSAGGAVSKEWSEKIGKAGPIVIDNSSAFRYDADVPLIVPEVNPDAIKDATKKNIIANPNCSTIQMVVALKPLHDVGKIKRVIVSTYQAVSGTGQKAIAELETQVRQLFNSQDPDVKVYPHQIAFNCLPQIDVFSDGDYTFEEIKMIKETNKIMGDDSIKVTATTVRVPVFYGHSESVNIETEKKITAKEARAILSQAPGVVVYDNPAEKIYPMPLMAGGEDPVFVGRIREDNTIENGLHLWIVADNIRKGAALNAVQIAEGLVSRQAITPRR